VFKISKACSGFMDHAKFFIDVSFEPHERRCPTPAVRHLHLLYSEIEVEMKSEQPAHNLQKMDSG